ncbi:MAG: hypothetical protein QE263_02465 [Vampirovibrionales bacterium]|nr:hypothetical protein [Vampirovibrionales bacterium]
MNRIAPQFSGVYSWRFQLTQAEKDALALEAEKNKGAQPKNNGWVIKNKYFPESIKSRLTKETKATSFDIQYIDHDRAVIVTNDRKGDHLELLAISSNPTKQIKTLAKLMNNPHGYLTTQNSQGDGVVYKSVWKITRFFKGIGNFFKRLFGSK